MKFLISMFIIATFSFAQENKTLSQVSKDHLIIQLEEFRDIAPADLEDSIIQINKKYDYYILTRQKECSGEFTSIEINSQGESEAVKRKLTKKEKKLCLLDLIYFRKKYQGEMFKARARALKFEQKKQLEALHKLKLDSLKKLDQLAKKIGEI